MKPKGSIGSIEDLQEHFNQLRHLQTPLPMTLLLTALLLGLGGHLCSLSRLENNYKEVAKYWSRNALT